MSLKELTRDKHTAAESTAFMRAVFQTKLPIDLWADFTYQKQLIYNGIEGVAGALGYLNDLPDIQRCHYLYLDYKSICPENRHSYRQETIDYYQYIRSLFDKGNSVLAHLYVWHMGDLYGGQQIKKIIKTSHRALEFKNPQLLVENIRSKLDDSLGPEALVAFDWAIKILESYDRNLE